MDETSLLERTRGCEQNNFNVTSLLFLPRKSASCALELECVQASRRYGIYPHALPRDKSNTIRYCDVRDVGYYLLTWLKMLNAWFCFFFSPMSVLYVPMYALTYYLHRYSGYG